MAVEQLLGSRVVALGDMFGEDGQGGAAKRARTIRAKATENFEERGLRTLLPAWGIATWVSERSAGTPAAPVLLRHAHLAPKGRAEESFELSLLDEWFVNPTLLHVLRTDVRVEVSDGELLELLDEGGGGAPDPRGLFERLAKTPSEVPGSRCPSGGGRQLVLRQMGDAPRP